MQRLFIFAFFAVLSLSGCYTLSGISIPDNVEKAYVPLYVENALGAPPTLYIDMTEALRNKVRDEARLEITEDDPDIEMKGTLVDFRVSAEGVAIEYKNLRDENDEGWKQNFSNFFDFPATQTLASVQEEAIEDITEQINEKIFNKAFAEDW